MKNLIIFILLIGIAYRLVMTANGNFLFNMDNARDMVDIREMVVLHKPRLIAHTAAIEGVFYGPYWYYMSIIPFLLTQGDPYGSILMQIVLWAIGGYFLLLMAKRWGFFSVIFAGSVWIASDFILLANLYAFNPNPALFLTPLLIYLIDKYLTTKKTKYSVLAFGLAGAFFSFEIIFAIVLPVIILLSILLTINYELLKKRSFWAGVATFIIIVSPQLLFEIRHGFLMTNSVVKYFSNVSGLGQVTNPPDRVIHVVSSFYGISVPTFINSKFLINILIVLSTIVVLYLIKKKDWQSNQVALITLLYIFVPIIVYVLIPTTINSWHWVAVAGGAILFASFVIGYLTKVKIAGKLAAFLVTIFALVTAINSIVNHIQYERGPNNDVSFYKNERAAIDYVYQKANGKNFKVYTYLPSVIDYPYQYLFWWYGQKKYGYVPGEYAYSRNKPQYISNKEKFEGRKDNFSNLVFLIKEPDRINMRVAWEGDFDDLRVISKEKVGPLEIEIREILDQK